MQTKSGSGGVTAGGALRAGFVLAILFFAALYTYIAFAELDYLSSAGRLGPGFFPRVIGVALVALCAVSLYVDLKHLPAAESVAPAWRSAAVLALLAGVFIGLLELLGGLVSMIAFMAAARCRMRSSPSCCRWASIWCSSCG
jgi:ABC-type transport system involved in cytochrome c biogenesis permease subunit